MRRTDRVGKTEERVRDNTALLSLHDVSPAFEDDVVKSCDRMADLGMESLTLLVTPFYGMKMVHSLEKNDLFCEYIQSLGLEISMHGYSHLSKSGAGDEFNRISSDRAAARLRSGFEAIERGMNSRPSGFVPPLWQAPVRIVDISKEVGFEYCIVGNRLYSHADSRVLTTTNYLVSEGTAKTSFVDSFLELELGGPVQVGVHPLDNRTNKVYELLEDMKDRLGYRLIGYRDYLVSVS